MKIQYESKITLWIYLFDNMACADVKNPCGEFEQRRRIIHFAAAESRKLRYNIKTATGFS